MKVLYYVPPVLCAMLFAVCALLFSACWTLKQGITLLEYLNRAAPLETLAENGDEHDAKFVHTINNIRRYAIDELGLTPTKNYTKYVSLNRDYLAAIVSASAQDSFRRYEWWFPVVGRVPYKGFFNVDDARREMQKLKQKNLDVLIRPVDAFSTLGWFTDPLYSFMRDYSEARLADLIIHESFHATLFLRGEVQFNEELAEFIGSCGARRYIAAQYGEASPEYAALSDEDGESAAFIASLKELIASLEALYARDIPREEKLSQKEEIIGAYKQRFINEYDNHFSTDRYRFVENISINNAYLELYRLYHESDTRLKTLYENSGSDLPAFIAAAKTLNNKSNPYLQLEAALALPSSGGEHK